MDKYFEERCKIKDIDNARKTAELIGGVFKGHYSCVDTIFKSKNADEKGIIVLRMFDINNRQSKNFIFTHKIAEWDGKTKSDRIILKGEFDKIGEIINFIVDHYGDLIRADYTYFKKGWEYALDKNRIFIEYIEKIGPTIEIEAENKDDLENLLKPFSVTECFSESTPEIVRKLLKNKK